MEHLAKNIKNIKLKSFSIEFLSGFKILKEKRNYIYIYKNNKL